MEIILRSAKIVDAGSPFHNQVKDILISNGTVKSIGVKLKAPAKVKEIKVDNLHVSLGWVDMNAFFADPGYEQRETIESGCKAAAFGGFTHVCCMPNTSPVTQTKAQIEYMLNKAERTIVSLHPIGALTENTEGKNLSEMYDMFTAGAVAFCDGVKADISAGMLERALLYVKAFDGLVMNHAEEKSTSKNGVMNEGALSTQMGLPGIPALAEEIAVTRDLYVLEYTKSKLHLLDISLKKSAELIRAAKKKGLQISASVNAHHLLLTEQATAGYNTNAKVNPPLRTSADTAALAKAIADGTIDTITSSHQPHDEEGKKLEFDKAEFGIIGLETCYPAANTALKGKADNTAIVSALSNNPRKILGLNNRIEEGALADLTLFNPDLKWTFSEKHIQSKSKNTPFVATTFTGKAVGVINKNKVQLFD